MAKIKAHHFLAAAAILVVLFKGNIRFFEKKENAWQSYVARQKFSGLVQKIYPDPDAPGYHKILMVNDTAQSVNMKFASQVAIGDSVSKKIYELNATVFKQNRTILIYDMVKNKPVKTQPSK